MLGLILILAIKCSLFSDFLTFERSNPTISLLFIRVPTGFHLQLHRQNTQNIKALKSQCLILKSSKQSFITPGGLLAYNFGPNIMAVFHDEADEDQLHLASSRLINKQESMFNVNIRPYFSEPVNKRMGLKDMVELFEPEGNHLRQEVSRFVRHQKSGLNNLGQLFTDFMIWRDGKSVA